MAQNQKSSRRILDKDAILSVFAAYLAKTTNHDEAFYLNNVIQLDAAVRSQKSFPWNDIAAQLDLDRWRLYHWYFETFQRALSGGIEKDDLQLMKDMIRDAVLHRQPLDKTFQTLIKEKMSKDYHRSSFSIAFNNAKRQVMKENGNISQRTEETSLLDSTQQQNDQIQQMMPSVIQTKSKQKQQAGMTRVQSQPNLQSNPLFRNYEKPVAPMFNPMYMQSQDLNGLSPIQYQQMLNVGNQYHQINSTVQKIAPPQHTGQPQIQEFQQFFYPQQQQQILAQYQQQQQQLIQQQEDLQQSNMQQQSPILLSLNVYAQNPNKLQNHPSQIQSHHGSNINMNVPQVLQPEISNASEIKQEYPLDDGINLSDITSHMDDSRDESYIYFDDVRFTAESQQDEGPSRVERSQMSDFQPTCGRFL